MKKFFSFLSSSKSFDEVKQGIKFLDIERVSHKSGISHHMIFKRDIIESLFKNIENNYNKELWKVFIDCIDFNIDSDSLASEYEIYFNYVLTYYKDEYNIRTVKWKNCSRIDFLNVKELQEQGFIYLAIQDYFINDFKSYKIE
jgi:hypothetical protein